MRFKTKFSGVFYRECTTNGKKDKTYYIRYMDKNGKNKELKVGRYSEGIRENYCNQKRNEIVTKERLGELPPVLVINTKKSYCLLSNIAKEYFNSRSEGNSKKVDQSLFKNYIEPYFSNIEFIDKVSIKKYTSKLEELNQVQNKTKKLSPKYKNNILSLLITINKYALENELTKNDFSKYIKKESVDNARERFLTKKEINQLYHFLQSDLILFVMCKLFLNTGARLETVLNISKKDINFENQILILKDFKNNTTYTSFLNDELNSLLESYTQSLIPSDKIFKSNPKRRLLKILNDLFNNGIEEDDTKNKIVIHSLRHTFASHLAINGTPIFTIQKLMNHKDIKQTMRYAKLAPDSGRESVKNLGF